MNSDSDSLTENDSFSEAIPTDDEKDTRQEKRRLTLILNRNSLPEYNFVKRKKNILETAVKDPQITLEVLKWGETDDELESELKLKCELGFSKKAVEMYEKWKMQKKLFERIRPRPFPEVFPVSIEKKMVQTSTFCDPKEVTVQRVRSNQDIFEKIPEFFNLNPFFVDMDEKFKTNWFSIPEELSELKKKAGINFGDLAYTLASGLTGKLVEKPKKTGEAPGKLNLESESENDKEEEFDDSPDIKQNEDKYEVDFEDQDAKDNPQMSENEGIPDTDADIEVHSVLSKKMKQEILKKATMYREEFSMKSVKTYFVMWKRKVEKLNEKKRQKIKKKEMKREKKMVEKSLIQREIVKVVEKDKAPTKELYYQKDEIEIKLRHGQPHDLSKFIKNCNNIYYISDGTEDAKKYVRRKKRDRKKKDKGKEKKSEKFTETVQSVNPTSKK